MWINWGKNFVRISYFKCIRKPPKFSKYIFLLKIFCQVYSSIWYVKKRYMPTRSMFTSRRKRLLFLVQPDISVSHSIKAWFWLSFYRVIERFFLFHSISLLNFVCCTIWYEKKTYANEKYVYQAPQKGQTVIIAAQQHGALSYRQHKVCY